MTAIRATTPPADRFNFAQHLIALNVCFSAAKLFFAYGLGNGLSFPLSVGATTILMAERPTADACFQRLTEQKATESGLTRSKAFVVLKSAGLASAYLADELKAIVKAKLAPHKYPRELDFVTELPKTATRKIQRFRLRELEKARSHSA